MINDICSSYFEWMCNKACNNRRLHSKTYYKLFMELYSTKFDYIVSMDENRYDDGIEMRYRFGYEMDISNDEIYKVMGSNPCSVLEMMVALSIRCEEHIMTKPELGDRTSKWFWVMIESLGLEQMDDLHYNERYVKNVLKIFLNRDYESDGKGGLFYIPKCNHDLRNAEIWYQLMWYLNYILKGEDRYA